MLLWDFPLGAVRSPANGTSVWGGVWVCLCCNRGHKTERKGPLHLIMGSLKHYFLSPYIRLQVLSHFSTQNVLLTRAPFIKTFPLPTPPLSSRSLVSFFFIRQVACQHPIITCAVFLGLLPPPACLHHDCVRSKATTFYWVLITLQPACSLHVSQTMTLLQVCYIRGGHKTSERSNICSVCE